MTRKFDDVTKNVKAALAPAQKLNALAVANVEKLAKLQLASLQTYSELGVSRLKAAAEVQDVNALQSYLASQTDFVRNVSEKFAADFEAMTELSREFIAEAQKISQEGFVVAGFKAA